MIRILAAVVVSAMLSNFSLESPDIYMKDLNPNQEDYSKVVLELKLGLREEVDGQVRVGMDERYVKARLYDLENGTRFTFGDGRDYMMFTD